MPNIPGTDDLNDINDPFAPDLPLAQRLRALESADAEPASDQVDGDPRMLAYAARLQALAAEFAAQRTLMRDQEKALVERIADVDDDRRLAVTQLQRAWQTQRDELAGDLRRPGWLAATALVLVLALGGGLIALYADVRAKHATLTAVIERLAAEQQRLVVELTAQAQTLPPMSTGTGTGSASTATEPAANIGIAVPTQPETPIGEAPATTPDAPPPADPPPADLAPADPAPGPMVSAPSEHAAATVTVADPTPLAVAAPTPAQDPEPETPFRVTDRPFALQLVGSHQRERLLELAANQVLPRYIYLHQETRRGRPWFVLIHSLYSNIEDAREALERLPPELRKPLPWIRALPPDTTLDRIPTGGSAG
jgi:DamX protein